MTNEERKAINNIKAFIRSIRSDLVEESEDNQELANDLDTALLLIQEQQEEIERLKTDNGNVWQLNANMSKRHLKDICKLKQKDKQIDLMARAIDNYDSQLEINTFKDKEHIKQYFVELVEKE